MVSRTFLAGALAVLSSRAVVAGPCRPISSSTVEVSYSSAATDSTSATVVFSSTETLSTETETLSTETLETSLTLPTTDVTTSTVIEEATTTTAEGFTTTELATSDATSYQTTETTITEAKTTTAAETTTTAAETTTTAAYAVPTAFKLISEDGDSQGLALAGANEPARSVFFGDVADADVHHAVFSYDSDAGKLSFESQTLCVYRDDYGWNAQVRTCPTDFYDSNKRYTPLICEKPTSDELKCRMAGSECEVSPSEIETYCYGNNLEWSQFYARPFTNGAYIVHFGIADATDEQLAELQLQPIGLEISGV